MNEHIVNAGPLAGLQHGLQLPENVSYWPPAPLWWLVAFLLVALVCWFILFLSQKYSLPLFGQTTKPTTESLAQTTERLLQQCYKQWQTDAAGTAYLEQANILLKRYVLSYNDACASHNTLISQQHTDAETKNTVNSVKPLPTTWHGLAWVEWMQQATAITLSQTTVQSLAEDCYRRETTLAPVPVVEIHRQLLQWIIDYEDQLYA